MYWFYHFCKIQQTAKSTVLDSSLGVKQTPPSITWSTVSSLLLLLPILFLTRDGQFSTYIDNHGTKVKSEVLVAMSGISTDLDTVSGTPSIRFNR